ncbi:hypothetical protein BC332_10268 [Capsicum chinense]|nr:hypothetical protein BC332_10268 [Capsicum chinense]
MGKVSPDDGQSKTPKQKKQSRSTKGKYLRSGALAQLRYTKDLEGIPLRLAWAKPKTKKPSSPPPSKQLPVHNHFVANLHFDARSKDLLEFFKANGANVVSAEVIFNDNPRQSAG